MSWVIFIIVVVIVAIWRITIWRCEIWRTAQEKVYETAFMLPEPPAPKKDVIEPKPEAMKTSLELFNHRYKKGQKFSWLEMIDFAEAYASQSPTQEAGVSEGRRDQIIWDLVKPIMDKFNDDDIIHIEITDVMLLMSKAIKTASLPVNPQAERLTHEKVKDVLVSKLYHVFQIKSPVYDELATAICSLSPVQAGVNEDKYMEARQIIRGFVRWQLEQEMVDPLTIDYEVAETYLDSRQSLPTPKREDAQERYDKAKDLIPALEAVFFFAPELKDITFKALRIAAGLPPAPEGGEEG